MDMSNICRICLNTKSELINLFMNEINNLSLADMLNDCIQLKIDINQNDSLPSVACSECAQLIKQFYNFKKICFNSDEKLHNFLIQIVEKNNRKIKQINCHICNIFFTNNLELKKHIKETHQEIKERDKNIESLKCNECGKTLCNKSNLNRHLLIHSNKRLFQCADCDSSFIQNAQLKDHIRRHHTFEKPFRCTKCDKKYFLQHDLKIHLNTHILEIKDIVLDDKFTCGICNENFDLESNFKKHKLLHITNNLCKNCGKTFTTKRGLKTHLELHNEQTIACEYCDKKFKSKHYLLVHLKSHEPKKYLCNFCGNKYATKKGLDLHMKVHSNFRPFVCNFGNCGKTFRFKNSLNLHNLTHTGEKKYGCNECGKKFAQSGHLFYHKQFHIGLRPFSCSFCNKSFTIKSNYSAHMKRHREKKTFTCEFCNHQCFNSLISLDKHKHKLHQVNI